MGYNTTVVVLNDALGEIEKDKEFGKKLAEAMRKVGLPGGSPVDVSAGRYANAATVIETHHSSEHVTVQVGGNTGTVVKNTGAEERSAIIDDIDSGLGVFGTALLEQRNPVELSAISAAITVLKGLRQRIRDACHIHSNKAWS